MATKKTAKKAPAKRSRKKVAESFAQMTKDALAAAHDRINGRIKDRKVKLHRYAGPVLEVSPYREGPSLASSPRNVPMTHAEALQFGQPSWPKDALDARMDAQARQRLNEGVFTGPQVNLSNAKLDSLAHPPMSEIDAVLGDICHSLDDLEDAQGQCINAIADILRQENPPAQTPQEIAAMPSAPLVNRLRSILRNLDSIIERQVAINARIVL